MNEAVKVVPGEALKNPRRPLSPRLSVYRWGMPMLASLAHRASGIVLVAFIPAYLWLFHGLTSSVADFSGVVAWMHSLAGRFFLWLVGASLIYHLCNGLRFILLDAGFLESRAAMRATARLCLALGVVGALMLGVRLW